MRCPLMAGRGSEGSQTPIRRPPLRPKVRYLGPLVFVLMRPPAIRTSRRAPCSPSSNPRRSTRRRRWGRSSRPASSPSRCPARGCKTSWCPARRGSRSGTSAATGSPRDRSQRPSMRARSRRRCTPRRRRSLVRAARQSSSCRWCWPPRSTWTRARPLTWTIPRRCWCCHRRRGQPPPRRGQRRRCWCPTTGAAPRALCASRRSAASTRSTSGPARQGARGPGRARRFGRVSLLDTHPEAHLQPLHR
mgnify:CR=1 FL=1